MATRGKSSTTRKTTRRRNPSLTSKITDIAGPSVSVIIGQALAANGTKLVLNQVPGASPMVKKILAFGIPAGIGAVLMMQKNKYAQSAGVGSVSAAVLYGLKTAMPALETNVPLAGNFAGLLADTNIEPESGFITDGEGNVYDSNGNLLFPNDEESVYLNDEDDSGFLNDYFEMEEEYAY